MNQGLEGGPNFGTKIFSLKTIQKLCVRCHLFWLYILLISSSGHNSNCDNCGCLSEDLVVFEAHPVYECDGPSMLRIPNVYKSHL